MRSVVKGTVAALIAGSTLLLLAIPVNAAIVEGASASAFGVKAHVIALGQVGLSVPGTPEVRVPTEAGDNKDASSIVGPVVVPTDGSVVQDVRVLSVNASRSQTGLATAQGESQVGHVALLPQAGKPLVEADALHAVSTSTCKSNGTATTSSDGSRFVGLFVNGQGISYTPAPNTTIPLVMGDRGVKVILNEQTGASRGTGLIVTMIHVIVYDAKSPNIIFADVRISSATSSVYCSKNAPPTGGNPADRGIEADKVVTSTTSDRVGQTATHDATAHRGDNVTWKITLSNKGANSCDVVVVSDTLPNHFTFVSSSGDLTSAKAPVQDGHKLTWKNSARWTLPAGGSLVENIVAKVDADAPYGTYVNNVDIDETTCSNFTQGLRGPVTVVPLGAEKRVLGFKNKKPAPAPSSAPLAATGWGVDPLKLLFVGLGLMGVGVLVSRRRRVM
ncbi:MAG: hypothetical protein NVSMB57_01320 [Actinomycetota bacterium]